MRMKANIVRMPLMVCMCTCIMTFLTMVVAAQTSVFVCNDTTHYGTSTFVDWYAIVDVTVGPPIWYIDGIPTYDTPSPGSKVTIDKQCLLLLDAASPTSLNDLCITGGGRIQLASRLIIGSRFAVANVSYLTAIPSPSSTTHVSDLTLLDGATMSLDYTANVSVTSLTFEGNDIIIDSCTLHSPHLPKRSPHTPCLFWPYTINRGVTGVRSGDIIR